MLPFIYSMWNGNDYSFTFIRRNLIRSRILTNNAFSILRPSRSHTVVAKHFFTFIRMTSEPCRCDATRRDTICHSQPEHILIFTSGGIQRRIVYRPVSTMKLIVMLIEWLFDAEELPPNDANIDTRTASRLWQAYVMPWSVCWPFNWNQTKKARLKKKQRCIEDVAKSLLRIFNRISSPWV